jgi:Sec7 domain/Pleckstrin homology domain
MECFDFHAISLDEAFRRFCVQLHLTGETQAVDRILFQMSSRYWNCNSEIQNMYRNIGGLMSLCVDIVYGILFSIVLLNTDLNTVNIGPKTSKKMQVKVFIKNTLSLLEGLIEKDPVLSKELAGVPEAYKTWKKALETTLKDIYSSVRDNPIIQNNPGKVPLTTSPSKSSSAWGSVGNLNGAGPSGRFGFLKKGKSVASLFDSPPKESPKSPLAPVSISQIVIEGVLIRKHVLTDDGEKAANRRWTKLWCAIRLSKDQGVELIMSKLSYEDKEYAESEQDTPVQYGETDEYPLIASAEVLEKHLLYQMNPQRTTLSIGSKYHSLDADSSTSIPSHPLLFSPSHEYRLVNQESETFSLIHSFSTSHFHGPQREHCLALHLANNNLYLFHAPTSDASRAWIETINYWAARKSREPLHGSIGNVDYGWASLTGTPSHGEPASGTSMEIERFQSIDSSGSGGATRPPQRRFAKGLKFVKWPDIPLSPRLISNKNEASL